ncbi:MAG: type I restriction endonuclease, partial [Pusillimonas sp.]
MSNPIPRRSLRPDPLPPIAMFQDENHKVEQPALDLLQRLGWQYLPGAQLAPAADTNPAQAAERSYFRDVVLVRRLEQAIKRLNPWISDENLRKVVRDITHPVHAGLMEYNHALWQMLVNYVSVEQDLGKGRKGQTVKIIDFDTPGNNDFLCTNQFKIEGPNQKIIPDIVCFVNGLPLAVIECKSPYTADAIAQGIDQLRRYANLRDPSSEEGAQKLFWYNQLMVSTCRDQARVGTLSSGTAHYADWKDAWPLTDRQILDLRTQPLAEQTATVLHTTDVPSPDYLHAAMRKAQGHSDAPDTLTAQERLLAGLFHCDHFLDIIQNFLIYEPIDGRLIKKVARYQQYRAVNKVIERLKTGTTRKEKSGVVWHTQGSGKSLTMVMLAVKM